MEVVQCLGGWGGVVVLGYGWLMVGYGWLVMVYQPLSQNKHGVIIPSFAGNCNEALSNQASIIAYSLLVRAVGWLICWLIR